MCKKFEVLTAVKVSMFVFWVITSCGLVRRYESFGGSMFLRNVGTYKSTRRYYPEDQHRQVYEPRKNGVKFLNCCMMLCTPTSYLKLHSPTD
jgi:hypothetical protein